MTSCVLMTHRYDSQRIVSATPVTPHSSLLTSPILDQSSPVDSGSVGHGGNGDVFRALPKPSVLTVGESLSPHSIRNQSDSRKSDHNKSSGGNAGNSRLSNTRRTSFAGCINYFHF